MKDLYEILLDLRKFVFTHKRYWLIPIILVFILLGLITFFSHPMVATPFIYTIF